MIPLFFDLNWSLPYFLGSKMLPHGALKVNKHLQVEGYEDVYAMGDCNDVPENKLAFGAEAQADIVAKNISNQYNKQALVEYKAGQWFSFTSTLNQ